jgi:hypothetical protein
MPGRAISAAFLACCLVLRSAEAGMGLDALGQYRLGMTAKEALAVPGTTIAAKCLPRGPAAECVLLRSTLPPHIGSTEFAIVLMLRKDRLMQVALESGARIPVGECARRFEAALLDLARSYRRFSPDALQRSRARFWADGLPSAQGPVFPALEPSEMSTVRLRSSNYARWKWDAGMGEWNPDGRQRWNGWSAQQKISGARRVLVRATHHLSYRLQEREVFESVAEKRVGPCSIQVLLAHSAFGNGSGTASPARSKAK